MSERKSMQAFGVVALVATRAFAAGEPDLLVFGPLEYVCVEDSPFDLLEPGERFYLDDLEDGSLNTPGVSASGVAMSPGPFTDSVDCDDGVIDGLGSAGWSLRGLDEMELTVIFDSRVLGGFPRAAGLVWTDGATVQEVLFEIFDATGSSLGVLRASPIGDGAADGGTAEDRFFGVFYAGGVSKLVITNVPRGPGGGIEVDHVQYGDVAQDSSCVGDVNGDGMVDGLDLGALLAVWSSDDGAGDLDGSGEVDGADLGLLLAAWGECAVAAQ